MGGVRRRRRRRAFLAFIQHEIVYAALKILMNTGNVWQQFEYTNFNPSQHVFRDNIQVRA